MTAGRDKSSSRPPPGEFEEYRLIRPIGQGSMGQVYLAEDRLLARLCAIKFIKATTPRTSAHDRFYAEARAIARLQHPNVVTVYRVGEVQQQPFLVSEYVRGQSIDQIDKPIPWTRALDIGIALARGLAAAHRKGVLHRDIKPANAMISDDGDVKLLDFGLAEVLPDDEWEAETRASDPSTQVHPVQNIDDGDATASLPPSHPQSIPDGAVSTIPFAGGRNHLVGTPLYAAPEVWRGEPATARADVYSLGVLLYELCAGRVPHDEQSLARMLTREAWTDPLPLREAASNVDPPFAAIVDRCLASNPLQRFESGDALREALEQLCARVASQKAIPEGNPYRGLATFEAEHQSLFFGRSTELLDVLDRLRSQRFVLVVGDSGVGKSSLCRAGVLPALADGQLGKRATLLTEPIILGQKPVDALAVALAPLVDVGIHEVAALISTEALSLGWKLRKKHPEGVILFIDQLEELCTLAASNDANHVAEALRVLVDPLVGVRLVATARSDFLSRLAAVPGLGDLISSSLYFLRPLEPQRLREAITGPAQAKGFSFESDQVVDTLVQSAGRAEGGLPLLQFALAELWNARDTERRCIPAAALANIGGVEGALARHADGLLAGLAQDQLTAARLLLLRLITAEGTRARRTEAELIDAVGDIDAARGALQALVRGRILVTTSTETGDQSAYEIAHEALVSGWDTLKGWLTRNAELRLVQHRLERAAAEWERLGRPRDSLWTRRQLAETRGLDVAQIQHHEAAFLAASHRSLQRKALARWALVLSVPTAIVLTIGVVQLLIRRNTQQKISEHLVAADDAMAKATKAISDAESLHQQARLTYDSGKTAAADETYARALKLDLDAEQAYTSAGQEIEFGLRLGGNPGKLGSLLADALYQRALLAERGRRFSQRDELIKRLETYDEGGRWLGRYRAPARLQIDTSPPGAEVRLIRFDSTKKPLNPEAVLGQTPLEVTDQGSILLTFAATEHIPVRLPLLLGRGQRIQISVDMPAQQDAPAGFIYVPPGSFLFGSDQTEQERLFWGFQPLHPVTTQAYFIAQHEVTFADWITYLRALSPDERKRRTPNASDATHALRIDEEKDGRYRLTIRPTLQAYSALEGEKIRYPDRTARASQDWLRFPVAAISYEDALAYAAWLNHTDRIPGARLCTEHEWERAARGADDRRFPHGDTLAKDDANFDETYGRLPLAFGPDEVGSHPASRSVLGVDDMAGNVWEWTSSVEQPGEPVLRGGGWYHRAMNSIVFNREPGERTLRGAVFGLRLCATPQPTSR